jgi:hypothetical protein
MNCLCPPASRTADCGMIVCMVCGKAHSRILEMRNGYCEREPGRQPYSRAKRFGRLLANVWGARVTLVPSELIKLLEKCRAKTTRDILCAIRHARARKLKRYDALAYLSREYLDINIEPLTHGQVVQSAHIFSEVEHHHFRIGGCFPAYSYLIEKILEELGRFDLCAYLHILKCRKRRDMYDRNYLPLIKSICGTSENVDTHRDHRPQILAQLNRFGDRFQSKKFLVENEQDAPRAIQL